MNKNQVTSYFCVFSRPTVAALREQVLRHPAVLPLVRTSVRQYGRSVVDLFPVSFADRILQDQRHRYHILVSSRRCRSLPLGININKLKDISRTRTTMNRLMCNDDRQSKVAVAQRRPKSASFVYSNDDELDDLVEMNMSAASDLDVTNGAQNPTVVGRMTAGVSDAALWSAEDDQTSKEEAVAEDELCK